MSLDQILEESGLDSVHEAKVDPEKRKSLFRLIKDRYDYGTYYRDRDLRNALFELMEFNPAIPQPLRNLLGQGRATSDRREDFIADWQADNDWAEPATSSFCLSDFFEFCQFGEEVIRPFAANNLHNEHYFYSKILEWFISYQHLQPISDAIIADIGAAYFGFGKIVEALPNVGQIQLVDIVFKKGVSQRTPKTFEVGASAAHLQPISDASVDLVTLHNAFEHFSEGADAGCIGEINRVLKPGGTALISPFFFAGRYTISLNPISAFFFQENKNLYDYVMKEYQENNAFLRFSKTMLSPYARIFSYSVFKNTFLERQNHLIPKLRRATFDSPKTENVPDELFGIEFRADYFSEKDFYYLEIAKPG